MNEKHWSDRGQNAEQFNTEANKTYEELEKNKERFRNMLKKPDVSLDLKPPWSVTDNSTSNYSEDENARKQAHAQQSETAQEHADDQRAQREANHRQQLEKEKKLQADAQEQQNQSAEEKRRAALATEAEQKRYEARAAFAKEAQLTADNEKLESYREQFRQATQQAQAINRDVE